MAKRTNSFSCKGELNLSEGVVYEVKKEYVDTIPFFDFLKEFDGKTVKISIVEDVEVTGTEDEGE
jgi:predicted RNA-binding protein